MKILIIGGGMAGLTYAIVACKNGLDVTVAERNSRAGKKIAMTGNGKCNIGNAKVDASCYNSSEIVERVIREISIDEYKRFLASCGIYTYTDGEGRMYPLSDSASNVVDCLRHQLAKFGGKLITDTEVTSITKLSDGYHVNLNGANYFFDKVVLACGSGSQAQAPYLTNLIPDIALTPLCPSLVPVRISHMDAILNGLRAKSTVYLFDGDKLLGSESGEVMFKDYGLSGICIFNLSAIIARQTVGRKCGNYTFSVDVLPTIDESDLQHILQHRIDSGERDKLFYGLLHNKISEHIVKRCGANADALALAHTAKNLTFNFDKLLDWSMSQVTAGGIDDSNIDADMLTLSNGIVAVGEVLNVDGVCGGNNLYFAAASSLYTFTGEQREKAYSLT